MEESKTAEGVTNEIRAILHILKLPNFKLPRVGQISPCPYEQLRYALMNIRMKLERIKKMEDL